MKDWVSGNFMEQNRTRPYHEMRENSGQDDWNEENDYLIIVTS